MVRKNLIKVPVLILLLMISICGCSDGNTKTAKPVEPQITKESLQAIYLSEENGYFSAAEIGKLKQAELTSDFAEFIRLAKQYPNAVLFIDHNAVKKVEIKELKGLLADNKQLLLVGYENPYQNIGLEEYWHKPLKGTFDKLPNRGFCQFLLITDDKHFDFTEEWQKKLPLLYRNDCYSFPKTLDEQMKKMVKNKKQYEVNNGQAYNYEW